MAAPVKICVCGSGADAHCLAGLAASREGFQVRVLLLDEDDAQKWKKSLRSNDIVIVTTDKDGNEKETASRPEVVTSNAGEVVKDSDFIIFTGPTYEHEEYFKAIAPHLHKKAVIVGLPGKPGFEFQFWDCAGELATQCTVVNFESTPWECRLLQFGKRVELFETKRFLDGSMVRGKAIPRKPALMTLQMIHGVEPMLKIAVHYLEITLKSYPFVGPAILYGRWKDWNGQSLKERPLFYEGVDLDTVEIINSCSTECHDIAVAIMAKFPGVVDLSDVSDIYKHYLQYYRDFIENTTDLHNILRTNKKFMGIKHPMTEDESGDLIPDFDCQFLREDIPNGLVVIRGLADTVGITVPAIDTLLLWCQDKMKKEYIVDGQLKGKDIQETRCPQRYGLDTIDAILNGNKK